MYNKISVLLAIIATTSAGYVNLYPHHGATSYNNIVNSYGSPIYEAPGQAGYGYDNVYGNGYGNGYDNGYGNGYGYDGGNHGDHYAYPKYAFSYGVNDPHTGDHKSQAEERDGDVVKGYYTVADPDGTLRTVHYTADDHNGFNAVVEKAGHAVHPVAVVEKVIPVYEKPVYAGYGYGNEYGNQYGLGHNAGYY